MLSMRKIDTIRRYKFDLDMPIRTICYKLDVAPSTVYKYIKIDDFSEMLKKPRKKRPRKMEPYEPIISSAVFGGGRHTWRLRQDIDLFKRNGQWLMIKSVAGMF